MKKRFIIPILIFGAYALYKYKFGRSTVFEKTYYWYLFILINQLSIF